MEGNVLHAIHSLATPQIDSIVLLLTNIAEPTFVAAFAIAIGLVYVYRHKWNWALLWIGGVAGVGAVAYGLKHLIARPRPELWGRLSEEAGYSLPSGHAVASMAVALCVVVMLWHTKWRNIAIVLSILYVVLIAFTRLYLGVHYPTDILSGWFVSAAWITLILIFMRRYPLR